MVRVPGSLRPPIFLALLTCTGLVLAGRAGAQWDPNGEPVPIDSEIEGFAMCPDASRGLFTFWIEGDFANATLHAHRRLVDGTTAPGWSAAGNLVGLAESSILSLTAAADGAGGAWVIASPRLFSQRGPLRVWHLLENGTSAPGFPDSGLALGDATHIKNAFIAGDGAGGVLAGWQEVLDYEFNDGDLYARFAVRLVRLASDGAIAPGWSAAGNTVFEPAPDGLKSQWRYEPEMIADGTGGAWIASVDSSDGEPDARLFRMTPAGSLAAGFPPGGLLIGTPEPRQIWATLASDGAGGVYTYGASGAYPDFDAWLGHYAPSGVPSPGWSAGGLAVLPGVAGSRGAGYLVGDGEGGVVLACATFDPSGLGFRLQRVHSNATTAAGWPANGVVVNDTWGDDWGMGLVSDGAGGAFLAGFARRDTTEYPFSLRQARVARVDGAGSFPTGWSADARVLTAWDAGKRFGVVGDGHGTCFVAHDLVTQPYLGCPCHTFVQRVGSDGSSSTGVGLARTTPGALRAAPNPSRGPVSVSVSTAETGPASVEVYDSAGRRVRTLHRGELGAGPHDLEWNGLDDSGRPAPAGIYVIRFRGERLQASQKVVRLL